MLLVALGLALALVALPATAAATVGPTTPGSAVDSNNPGTAQDFRTIASSTESVARLSVYLDAASTASQVELGLYSGSTTAAGTRLARCVITAPVANAWNRCTFTAVSITSGQAYWLSVLQPTGTTGKIRFRNSFGSGSSFGSSSTTLASLPTTWANGPSWGAQTASIYADQTGTTPPPTTPAPPTARFSVSPSAPTTGTATTFNSAGSTCAATPCTYAWADDGTDGPGGTQWPLGSGQTLSFTFVNAGTKNVRLTITDARSRTATTVKAVTVSAPSTPPPTTPPPTTPPASCSRNATPSTFSSEWSAATGGQKICLAAGSYGSFSGSGSAKSSTVTIAAQSGATATMSVNFNGTGNIRLDGLRITSASLQGSTRNITIANSTFTGDTIIRPTSNSNIVFDSNTHNNITPSGSYEGRITLSSNSAPSGVVIKNSQFSGGLSDGIQNGSNGTQILNNEFSNIHQGDPNIAHTDALQLYGSRNTVVKGNYFHDVEDCIMAPDGTDHETITDNICVTDGSQNGFTIGADNGSTISHNTFGANGLRLYGGNQNRASTGTIVKDNILPSGNTITGTGLTVDYNMSPGTTAGTHAIRAAPIFAGGSRPTTKAGFALSSSSPGNNAASDGTDVGVRF